MSESAEVVIVGGGIGGSALATVLARNGRDVLVLERETVYRDKVRGETLPPWGTGEVQKLDLLDTLLGAGGSFCTRMVPYDEVFAPEEAEAGAFPLDSVLPGVPGELDVGHPQACEALARGAAEAGACVVRGVAKLQLTPGPKPSVAYSLSGEWREVSCRIAVGADGRNSSVRRQIASELHASEPRSMAAGLLVEELHEWPEDLQVLGSEGDFSFLVFPRPKGVVRLYLFWDARLGNRFSGEERSRHFLDAYRVGCLPLGEAVAAARPAGPCATYPMNDTWIDEPFAEGVVLIGDAAGWNDPIIGQGLSIAIRDARLVAEALLGSPDWSVGIFADYAAERRERMRRLRICAAITTDLRLRLEPEAPERRKAIFTRGISDPLIAGVLFCAIAGPDRAPAEAFERANLERILAYR